MFLTFSKMTDKISAIEMERRDEEDDEGIPLNDEGIPLNAADAEPASDTLDAALIELVGLQSIKH